jgi:hypothetical protein
MQVKKLRSEFVRRSQLMKLKMESTVSKMVEKQIFPSTVPQIKIKVKKKTFLKKYGSRR